MATANSIYKFFKLRQKELRSNEKQKDNFNRVLTKAYNAGKITEKQFNSLMIK